MSAAIKSSEFISVENYLKEELTRQVKHELIDGNIDALDDVTANHNRISINLLQQFGNHLENSPCEPFGSMKLRVKDNFFYPDVMVDANLMNPSRITPKRLC